MCRTIQNNARYVRKRTNKNFNDNLFLHEIRGLRWWDVYTTTEVDKAVEIFTTKLMEFLTVVNLSRQSGKFPSFYIYNANKVVMQH